LDAWQITAPLLGDSALVAGTLRIHGLHLFVLTLTWLIYTCLLKMPW
jgi:hypothetical protein